MANPSVTSVLEVHSFTYNNLNFVLSALKCSKVKI